MQTDAQTRTQTHTRTFKDHALPNSYAYTTNTLFKTIDIYETFKITYFNIINHMLKLEYHRFFSYLDILKILEYLHHGYTQNITH